MELPVPRPTLSCTALNGLQGTLEAKIRASLPAQAPSFCARSPSLQRIMWNFLIRRLRVPSLNGHGPSDPQGLLTNIPSFHNEGVHDVRWQERNKTNLRPYKMQPLYQESTFSIKLLTSFPSRFNVIILQQVKFA